MVSLTTYQEAKEHTTNNGRMVKPRGKYAPNLFKFQELCCSGKLSDFEKARDYYDALVPGAQRYIRKYRASNGEVDVIKLRERLGRFSAGGIANAVAISMLERWVKGVITLSNVPE